MTCEGVIMTPTLSIFELLNLLDVRVASMCRIRAPAGEVPELQQGDEEFLAVVPILESVPHSSKVVLGITRKVSWKHISGCFVQLGVQCSEVRDIGTRNCKQEGYAINILISNITPWSSGFDAGSVSGKLGFQSQPASKICYHGVTEHILVFSQ